MFHARPLNGIEIGLVTLQLFPWTVRSQTGLASVGVTGGVVAASRRDHGKLQRMRKSVKKHQQNRAKYASYKEGQAENSLDNAESLDHKQKKKHKKPKIANDSGRKNQRGPTDDEPRGSGKQSQKKRRSPSKPKSRTRI